MYSDWNARGLLELGIALLSIRAVDMGNVMGKRTLAIVFLAGVRLQMSRTTKLLVRNTSDGVTFTSLGRVG